MEWFVGAQSVNDGAQIWELRCSEAVLYVESGQ
jgi:hypothetical protein